MTSISARGAKGLAGSIALAGLVTLAVFLLTHRISLGELDLLTGWDSRTYVRMGLMGPFAPHAHNAPFAYRVLFPELAFLLKASPALVYPTVWLASTILALVGVILICRHVGASAFAGAVAGSLIVLTSPYRESLGDQMVIDAPSVAIAVWSMLFSLRRRYWSLALLLTVAGLNRELSILLALPALWTLATADKGAPGGRASRVTVLVALVAGPLGSALAMRLLIHPALSFGVMDAIRLALSVLPSWPIAVTGKSAGWLLPLAIAAFIRPKGLPEAFWIAAAGPFLFGLAQSVLGVDIPRLILPALTGAAVLAAICIDRIGDKAWLAVVLLPLQYFSFVNSRLDPELYMRLPAIGVLKYALAISSILAAVAAAVWVVLRRRQTGPLIAAADPVR